MGEDLNKANEKFKRLLKEIRIKRNITQEVSELLYLFYLEGFKDGSGNVQLIQ